MAENEIFCICIDETLLKSRLATRQRNIPGWYEIDWVEVEWSKAHFPPWTEERLITDAVQPLAENIQAVLSYINA